MSQRTSAVACGINVEMMEIAPGVDKQKGEELVLDLLWCLCEDMP